MLYSIAVMGGQQVKVHKDLELFLHKLDAKKGDTIESKEVLLIDDNGKVTLGKPHIAGASVKAKVIEHKLDDHFTVFKKNRRKGYQKANGHKNYVTKVVITDIKASGSKAAPKKEAEAKPKAAKK